MNDHTQNPETCAEVSADLAEFALGTLSGRTRARVLEHLDTCRRCSAEMEALASVSDALLELAPEADPPLGFELRIAQRLGAEASHHRSMRRSHRMVRIAAVVVLVAVLGVVGGVLGTQGGAPTQGARPATALLTSQGQKLGRVFITAGSPSWITMNIGDDHLSGVVWCRVELKDGAVETVGRFTLSGGYGAWSAKVDAAGSQVRAAQVVDADGHVLATATFSS